MSQHWNELYAQTQDLYGTAANLFIQEIARKIRIEGKTLASFTWLSRQDSIIILFRRKFGIIPMLL